MVWALRDKSPWAVPEGLWALHCLPALGNLTDRWIDTQVRSGTRFAGAALGPLPSQLGRPKGPTTNWLPATRLDRYLAYRGMFKSRGYSPLYLKAAFRDNPPAVIHGHYGHVASRLVHLAGALDVPLVGSFYGADISKFAVLQDPSRRRWYRELFESAHSIVAEGPAMAERIAHAGCPESKIDVVRLPADDQVLNTISEARGEGFVVAVAGRFIEKKGFATAVEAFAIGLGGKREARLLVIGGGPLEGTLREIVDRYEIGDQVQWAGRLNFKDFMTQIASASVALYPSIVAQDGDSEGGAPVTLIEAQWLGVPSIVSDQDDLPFVSAPEGSVVIDSVDSRVWADALVELFGSPGNLQRMSEAARSFVRDYHSPEKTSSERESVYLRGSSQSNERGDART